MTQSSRITEDSDDLPVFEEGEEFLEMQEKEASVVPSRSIHSSQENVSTSSDKEHPTKVAEIGIVNRGRSSLDSGTGAFELHSLRKNSNEHTSYC